LLVASLLAGFGAGCGRKAPAPLPPGEALNLQPRASWRHPIRGGETQPFHFRLPDRTLLVLEIPQRVVELSARILNERGEEVAAAEGWDGPDSPRLLLTGKGGGAYRLEITARAAPQVRGSYELAVRELRPAVARDEIRSRAARSLAQGRRLMALDRPAEALKELGASLDLWRTAADRRGETEVLRSLGDLELGRQSYKAALDPYEKALASSRQCGWRGGEALILSSQGLCNVQLGNYGEAIRFYEASLAIWDESGDPYERSYALQSLSYGYDRQGDPRAALSLLRKALPLAEAAGDLMGQARIINAIGSAQSSGGHPSEALETLQKALALSRALGNQVLARDIEGNLGALYYKKGQLQKAVDVFTHLIAESQPDQRGWLYLYLGAVYLDLGEPGKARKEYELALGTFRRAGDRANEVSSLIGLGSACQRTGDPRAALPFFEQSYRALPKPTWDSLHHYGLALYRAGKPLEALPLLEQAVKIARESHTPENEAKTLLALGSTNRDLGKADLAATQLGQAISLGKTIDFPSIEAQAFSQRAMLRKGQGNLTAARRDAEKALEIVESTRQSIAGQQIRTSFLANRRSVYDFYVNLLLDLDRAHPGERYGALALWASERSRGRGLLDLLTEGRIDVAKEMPPDLRRREGELSDGLARVQSDLRSGNPPAGRVKELQGELDRLDEQRQQLDWEIRARNPRYAEIRYPTPLKLEEIQRQVVDGDTALLEFALGETSSTLFVVTRDGLSTYRLPPSQLIAELVRRLRPALERESFRSRGEYLETALRLYQILLEPAARVLKDKTDLLIVPDGALYYVPFEVLLTEPAGDRGYRDLPYLLRRCSIAYVPSASVLAGLREPRRDVPPAGREQVAAFAPFAHVAGSPAGREAVLRGISRDPTGNLYAPLPSSSREVSSIAGLYPGKSLSFLDGRATETELKTNPAVAASRRLHLATHAETDEAHPESSALVLKPDGRSDGMLRVDEIFNLKLSADLAVLSACRTALGKEVTGEGLVGLTRAFFYAGVPSLVVSLWNVTDGPAPDLMLDFYKDLDRLHRKARALREAKLAMIGRGTYSHPSYWAPFILLGEPR
jgi:CHAT domain-containing protein/tetratricopeptide (TPR) repeat protein